MPTHTQEEEEHDEIEKQMEEGKGNQGSGHHFVHQAIHHLQLVLFPVTWFLLFLKYFKFFLFFPRFLYCF